MTYENRNGMSVEYSKKYGWVVFFNGYQALVFTLDDARFIRDAFAQAVIDFDLEIMAEKLITEEKIDS